MNIEERLEKIEKTLEYHTSLLEDIFNAIESKTTGAGRREQIHTQLEGMKHVIANATGNNKQVMSVFENICNSVTK